MKKTILITLFLCSLNLFGQETEKSSQKSDIIENFIRLSTQELFDTANYYLKRYSFDTALICYNLTINAIPKNADIEQQKKLVEAYNKLANIYFFISDYRMAYDLSIKRLLICEKYNFVDEKLQTFINIGVVYTSVKQYDIAKQYYLNALELCNDSNKIILILNNLGANEMEIGNNENAIYYINKSMQISKRHNDAYLHLILNNIASYYQKKKQYDSAFHYFRLSLDHTLINNNIEVEVNNLSDLGKLFFEVNKIDSALHYINLSNKIAMENKFLRILSDNYRTLSKIEKSKGRFENSLHLHETYTNLKDSIFNAGVFGSINLLQRQYEVSKTNQQIEELVIEKQLKENIIRYQNIILYIIISVSLLMGFALFLIISKNKKLKKAYNILVDKNIEIVELQENPSDVNEKKNKKSALNDDSQNELLSNILNIMENIEIICDADFTVDKLAKLVKSNQLYVSTAINEGLKMNFRSLLNKYRIKEAQRLLSNNETHKYTIEFIASKIGYKSPNTFREAFNDVTGVNPYFYLKSMKK